MASVSGWMRWAFRLMVSPGWPLVAEMEKGRLRPASAPSMCWMRAQWAASKSASWGRLRRRGR